MGLPKPKEPRTVGRYVLFQEFAHGGMATVHLGKLRGLAGFARTVAIKRLHSHAARDPEFVGMFLDEARLAARIQHPNVVSVLDVVQADGELFIVMDYVHGESFYHLLRAAGEQSIILPRRILVTIVASVLSGLHSAHEAKNERGKELGIVHRDVSPQNVLLGLDGVARVLDFGVAKAKERVHWSTQDGQLKGKLRYMPPEQLRSGEVDRRTDVYAASVMLWEGLTGRRLFEPTEPGALLAAILTQSLEPPSRYAPDTPRTLDAIVMKGLSRNKEERYATARDMADALEEAVPVVSARQVGEWVERVAAKKLRERADAIHQIEGMELPAEDPEAYSGPKPISEEEWQSGRVKQPEPEEEQGGSLASGRPEMPSYAGEKRTGSGSFELALDELSKEGGQVPARALAHEGTPSSTGARIRADAPAPPAARAEAPSPVKPAPVAPEVVQADEPEAPTVVRAPVFDVESSPWPDTPGDVKERFPLLARLPAGWRLWTIMAGVLLGAISAIGYASCSSGGRAVQVAATAPVASATSAASAPLVPPVPVEPPSTAQAPVAPPAPTVAATPPSPLPAPKPPAAAAPVVHNAPPAPATPKPASKPKPSCNPPYTVDADGVRVLKRECF